MSTQAGDYLITKINLATMEDSSPDYGVVENAAIVVNQDIIKWVGALLDLPDVYSDLTRIDGSCNGENGWVTPGLIDCHTHIVYGGNRAKEFEMRLQGASYEEIARAGGGIANTVKATRAATNEQLFNNSLPRAKALMSQGVTSIEIKSGYGLDTVTEKKMLQVAEQINQQLPVTIYKTFLGAHALPPEFANQPDDYIQYICDHMLPEIHAEGLIDAVDAFCENIGFNYQQVDKLFSHAKELGIKVKLHAEQLSDQRGAELAASYKALSADHLEYLTEQGVEAMAAAGTVAVVLPGAFYFLRETKLPPLELLREKQVPIAIATDSNPGSSPITNLPLMLNMACTLFRMTPAEALQGVTINAAKALGIAENYGSIKVGKKADLAIWNIGHPAELSYQTGVNPLVKLIKHGEVVIA